MDTSIDTRPVHPNSTTVFTIFGRVHHSVYINAVLSTFQCVYQKTAGQFILILQFPQYLAVHVKERAVGFSVPQCNSIRIPFCTSVNINSVLMTSLEVLIFPGKLWGCSYSGIFLFNFSLYLLHGNVCAKGEIVVH